MIERLQEQAESRHQRLLNRRAAAKVMEEEKQRAKEEAERLWLEAAAALIGFSQQEFREIWEDKLISNQQMNNKFKHILSLQITKNNKQLQLVLPILANRQ